jgi:hypothetical protein
MAGITQVQLSDCRLNRITPPQSYDPGLVWIRFTNVSVWMEVVSQAEGMLIYHSSMYIQ